MLTAATDVEAGLNLDDFRELTGIELPPGPYQTVAGFVIDRLGRLPAVGDTIQYDGLEISVREMQRRRMSKINVVPRAVEGPVDLAVDQPLNQPLF
jgi:putative hemolysin